MLTRPAQPALTAALGAAALGLLVCSFLVARALRDDAAPAPADGAHAAQPYRARSVTGTLVPRATAADFRAPLRRYRRHVRSELAAMSAEVARLRAALARDDLGGARAALLRAQARYGTIGAAYGAFGDLDTAVDGLPDAGARRLTGVHLVERALWHDDATRAARAAAARLERDVTRMRRAVATLTIDPLDYALRAHEILEDSLHLALSGRANRWSGAALVDLQANVAGTRFVLGTLRALLVRRDPEGRLPQARRALARLQATLARLRRADGSFPRWDAVRRGDRERVDALTAAAAEQLAYVPELIDPRPPRPAQRAFGA